MSTATIPLLNRPGFFPGALSTAIGLSSHDYVDLTSIDGDSGLREAYRIWWLLEQVTFVFTGTINDGAVSRSFSKQFRAPDSLDTGTSVTNTVGGSIVGTDTSGGPVPPSEPAFRSALQTSSILNSTVVNYSQGWNYPPNDEQETGTISLIIQLVSGQWRLYYKFQGAITARDPFLDNAVLRIENPSYDGISAVKTGTASLLGYTINWKSYINGSAASSSGEGLSCSTVEWSY
jgi:hypothetical protein